MFQTKVVKKIKKHFMFGNFFRKSRCLWDNVERYSRTRPATDDNLAHEHCMQDN